MYKYSDQELLDILRKKAEELNRTPSARDLKNPCYTVFSDRFGTWNEALEKAGLKKNSTIKNKNITKEEIIEIFKKEVKKVTGKCTKRNFNKSSTHKAGWFIYNLGLEWNELLSLTSIECNTIKNRSEEEILQDLKKIINELEYIPSIGKLKEMHFPIYVLEKKGYTYAEILKKIGKQNNNKTPDIVKESDEELLKKYIEFSNKIGKGDVGASAYDLNNSEDIYNADVFCTRFSGINELKKKAGYEPVIKKKRYTKEELKKDLLEEYYKLGRKLSVKEINKNKSLASSMTYLRYFKTTKMSKVWEAIGIHNE